METQIEVNGQVIVLADTNPLYDEGYSQWKNINTGEIWNVDGSRAKACLNAEIAQHGIIKVRAPYYVEWEYDKATETYYEYHGRVSGIKDPYGWVHVCGIDYDYDKTNIVQQVEKINPDNNWNQFEIERGGFGNFDEIWCKVKCFERGVGYVPSCGSIVAAACSEWCEFRHSWYNKIIVDTDGGRYNVWRDWNSFLQEDGEDPLEYLIIEAENIVKKKRFLTNP